MKKLSDYERGFLEAVIDAEGCLSLTIQKINRPRDEERGWLREPKRKWKPIILLSISNNSLEFINKIQKILGTKLKPVRKKGTNNYQIKLRHNVLRWLLPQLKLVIKEEKRKLAIELLSILKHGNNQYTNTPEHEKRLAEIVDRWKMLDNH